MKPIILQRPTFHRFGVVCLSLLLSIVACADTAKVQEYIIQGTVIDSTAGLPISNARIVLIKHGGTQYGEDLFTDSDGGYGIEKPGEQVEAIIVFAEGFRPRWLDIESDIPQAHDFKLIRETRTWQLGHGDTQQPYSAEELERMATGDSILSKNTKLEKR